MSEISLAASRKIKLKLLADEGSINAQRVLKMQENPGMFFTVVAEVSSRDVARPDGITLRSVISSVAPEADVALLARLYDVPRL
ncbi:hypothetical protein ONN26_25525, partial [Salmonella enterica subsp. enterica serovar Muenster]|nr:hypothetical protein [Salmonella enterica subsp. enterica serovar Muenster]